MSLTLLQGYSSAEEEEEEEQQVQYENSSEDGEDDAVRVNRPVSNKSLFDPPNASSSSSLLPSAFDAFSEIAGPPVFLNNSVEEQSAVKENNERRWRHGQKNRRDKKDLPSGAVVTAKAQLVGIHERVRSDVDGNFARASLVQPNSSESNAQGGGKLKPTATNPNAEDAAELLRMCVRCGIPKTYTSVKGIVCPVCGDRPPTDTDNESAKKKGSTVKDKEKSKRMKGQSSHATWKSETEMQLRQQFD